jgi:hypothetical protein
MVGEAKTGELNKNKTTCISNKKNSEYDQMKRQTSIDRSIENAQLIDRYLIILISRLYVYIYRFGFLDK